MNLNGGKNSGSKIDTGREIYESGDPRGEESLGARRSADRIPKVYIGSMNPKAGCAGSVLNLLDEKGFNHQVETEEGLLGEECSMMLKEFFKELREKRKKKKEEKAGE